MITRTVLTEDIDFAVDFYVHVFQTGIKYVRKEDIPIALSIFKLSDILTLKEAIQRVEQQIKEASLLDLHELIPYLRYKKKKWEEELLTLIKERIRFLLYLIWKNNISFCIVI